MNSRIKSILVFSFFILIANATKAQESGTKDFKNIDLKELRKAFVNQLLDDGLIKRKKDDIHLALRSEMTLLNEQVLDKELHEKYGNLAAQFDIKRGSYRVIYITHQCTAVGDFLDDSFSGKIQGKMNLNELKVSIQ
ncbi:hypothetical protein [Ekhidna sp. To15]|uniref:hypothetical protein n=1 Tax=Ekhidna sp. To15 TaxID=3395267 RepID=UPI003F51F700